MALSITRVVLYKHGVGYFEREGKVEGDAAIALTFRQTEVSDVLKSLTVLDLDGGHIASVSYDSTKPLEQLLAEVALSIPDKGSLVHLLPQIKGARVALHSGVADPVEGVILGIDTTDRQTGDGVVHVVLVSILTDRGDVRSFDLHSLFSVQLLDATMRRDLDFYLKTQLSAKKKDARTFTFFAQGTGERTIRLSYTLEAPVWKATYRILLGEPATQGGASNKPPMIQGWAVVDNMQDEDWENVQLSLIAGLPVSFTHDLYTPRYIRRPDVKVQETTGVLPPIVEAGMALAEESEEADMMYMAMAAPVAAAPVRGGGSRKMRKMEASSGSGGPSSMPTQVRERKVGDLFEYEIEHPVTIKRNQSALVPIVLREFAGQPVLLHNRHTRPANPMRCVEFKNTTGLTLEGGPVTVLEAGNYVGEAMLETMKPDEERLVPYSVELGVHVLDNVGSHNERFHRIVIRKGILRLYYVQVQQMTYQFNNKSDTVQIVYLEHLRLGNEWELFDTPKPHEVTENYWRFRFTIEPKKVTTFVVKSRQPLNYQFVLIDVSSQQVGTWVDQKYIDAKTEKTFKQAFEQRSTIDVLEGVLRTLEKERATIHNEQKRIRENLQSIGDRPGEKELRERYLKTMGTQEDRLDEISKEMDSQTKVIELCREKMNAILAKLEYDAEM